MVNLDVHKFTIYTVSTTKSTDKTLMLILAKLSKTLLKRRYFSSIFIRLLVKSQNYERVLLQDEILLPFEKQKERSKEEKKKTEVTTSSSQLKMKSYSFTHRLPSRPSVCDKLTKKIH